ncbi:MmgE/PrpD family protein [Ramlibacter sp. MMS24-I3-19]|uniref:MmgE/PrpD family protein n=1 Tax=Ramlibacter sp. MMS24-I3-19 TaxID=3416606 RepID=UPI003D06181D
MTITRRVFAGAMLAPAVPLVWAEGRKEPGPVMQRLSTYMAEAASRPLPDSVVLQTKYHILDTLGAIVSGSKLAPGAAALAYARTHAGGGRATVAVSRLTCAAADAALANGVMAHSDETDDSHNASRSHPGCSVVPAALATAEQLGADGQHLLRAVALGYDIGTRVVLAMGGAEFSYSSSLATHSIAGNFGAAAAAGCIARLDARQMRWLLDYASQQSSGIVAWRRDTDHIEKAFVFAGMPARNGVTSALLVQAGWNGVDDVFSGADNFFQAYAPQGKPERAIEQLGERFEIAQTDIKKWTVGSPIQAPLDAIELIQARRPFRPEDVRRVTVRVAPSVGAVVDNRDMPDISLQHMVAVMLLDGTASFHAAHDKPRMADPAVQRERAKVQLAPDEELAKLLPVRVTVVEIEFTDGSKATERVTAVRGTPRNPMSQREVEEKARDLIAPVLGAPAADRLLATIGRLEQVADVRELRPLLQQA